MKNIWEETIKAVKNGARFHINFETQTFDIWLKDKYQAEHKKVIIKNGKYTGELGLDTSNDNVLEKIEELYDRYKHSTPNQVSDKKRYTYFRPLAEDKLEDEDMFYGDNRNLAQIKLELYFLIIVLNGTLKWSEDMGKWFWQSTKDKDLIILKSWIEN